MKKIQMMGWLLLVLAINSEAKTLRIAVASNFVEPMHAWIDAFPGAQEHEVQVISASTGKLYAQIKRGAPFDVFFAADTLTPKKLYDEGLGTEPVAYAQGQLTLLGPATKNDCQYWLENTALGHMAWANPSIAPYGLAAEQTMKKLGVFKAWKKRMVQGENVAQSAHYFTTGNAAMAWVARSQAQAILSQRAGCHWHVPSGMHEPIIQSATIPKHAPSGDLAHMFLDWTQSEAAQELLLDWGYVRMVHD